MGAITNTKSKVKKITSRAEGYLEVKDLYPAIRKLVPSAPPEAKISVFVQVPSGMPLDINENLNIQFSVTWDEKE